MHGSTKITKRIDKAIQQIERDKEKLGEMCEELDGLISEFLERCLRKRRAIEYLGIKIEINKILVDALKEKYESVRKEKDPIMILDAILPLLVLTKLVIMGIDEYDIEVLRKFSPVGENVAKYFSLKKLLDSYFPGNSEIVKELIPNKVDLYEREI